MKTLSSLILLLFLTLNGACYSQQTISFDSEDLTFEIRDTIFIVSGFYYLSSKVDKEFLLIYPFPTDTIYGTPFDVSIHNLSTNHPVSYKPSRNNSYVSFITSYTDDTPLLISYKQPFRANRVKYILLTTQSWNKPLTTANYKLITDKDLKIIYFSIPPDESITVDDKNIFFWHIENFMPDRDFEIVFD